MTTLAAGELRAGGSASSDTRCTHCGLGVPAGLIEPGESKQFCCGACKIAHSAITAAGFEDYYALRERLDASPDRSKSSGGGFEAFDDPGFTSMHVTAEPDGSLSCELYLEGVHCAACVWLVERLPRVAQGVREARLDLGRSLVRLRWDPSAIGLSAAARALDRFGYRPHPATASSQRDARRAADRAGLIRVGVAGACAGNVMLLAAALYSGMLDGMDEGTRNAFRLLSAAIAFVSVVWPGRVFFTGAFAALRVRAWHLDMPIALALGVGLVTGVIHSVRGQGEVYFDSVTMLVFFLLVGRWLQDRGVRAAADSVELLYSLTPSAARRVEADGSVREVPSSTLEPGDLVELRAGEPSPVDGVIESGRTTVDASVITGEPRPVVSGEGDRIAAGSMNVSSTVRMRAEAVGVETRLGRVMRTIERLGRERVPFLGRADRMAGPFVIVVSTLAVICIAAWWRAGAELAIEHATALLIVACPCALALATPLVTAAAVGRAARAGVLVKGAETFERLSARRGGRLGGPGLVLLDKTGTLTEGAFRLLGCEGEASVLPMAAALERESSHPIAAALGEADDRGLSASGVSHVHGFGVVGEVSGPVSAGVRVAVGRAAWVAERVGAVPGEVLAAAERAAGEGHTSIVIGSSDGRFAAAVLGDRIRDDARAMVDALRSRGWRVGVLSGDREETVRSVAASLGIDGALARGGASPEDKLARVEAALADGPVVMIGDGVNDAAALAKATVGIAVHGGAEASLAAADVYVTEPELSRVVELFDGSRRTVLAVKRCLGASLAYNVTASSLAMLGLITPLLAAVIMPSSSLTVVCLALGARTFLRRGAESLR
ncbi:MAG: heavy metal translocating P-type ATPase [Planctomycetota bacterium]